MGLYRFRAVVLCAVMGASLPAVAGSVTATLSVSATVAPSCGVALLVNARTDARAVGPVRVACSMPTAYRVHTATGAEIAAIESIDALRVAQAQPTDAATQAAEDVQRITIEY